MNLFSRTHVFVIFFIFLLAVAGIAFVKERERTQAGLAALSEPDKSEHVIRATSAGFTPNMITIRNGDTLRFVNDTDEPFWPASNLHPTHTLYESFDAKRPLYPEEEWSFVFDKPGRWSYHDHLNPQKTGLVLVLTSDGEVPKISTVCDELSSQEKIQCFDQTLEQTLLENGIEAAFDYFSSIYNADPEVPIVCHGWAHRLGETAYRTYKESNELSFRPEATFCSYGYFHGFINAMVEDTQSLEQAQHFCDEVMDTATGLTGMQSNCIHGIGHSIATLMLEDPENWGDFQKVIGKASVQCEKLYESTLHRSFCFDGMFHEVHWSIQREDYGFTQEEYAASKDLFHYCKTTPSNVLESCFYDFVTIWPYFFNTKQKAMEYVLNTIPPELALRPLRTFARSFIEMEITSGKYQDSVDACHIVSGPLAVACMEGLVLGFVTHGEPGNAHEEGFAFCRTYYEGNERTLCLTKMLDELSWNYTSSQMKEACAFLGNNERTTKCDQ